MAGIQKLNEVIASLETQSEELSSFNGLLMEVRAANGDFRERTDAFTEVSEALKAHLKQNISKIDEFEKKLFEMEKDFAQTKEICVQIANEIRELDIVTPKQLNNGIDEIRKRNFEIEKGLNEIKEISLQINTSLGRLDFVTPLELNNGIEKVNLELATVNIKVAEKINSIDMSINSAKSLILKLSISNLIAIFALIYMLLIN